MNTNSPELSGIVGNSSYASANFPDANEVSLYDYSMSLDTNYSTAVNNAMIKHINEVKEKTENVTSSITTNWKRKFRDFLITKNTKLLEFLTAKIKIHPVLGTVENFFQIFGKENINFNNQTLREIILDISGNANILDEINAVCLSKEMLPLAKYIEQTNFLMNEYKLTAEKIIDKENLLKIKLDTLNSIQGKLRTVLGVRRNEHYDELMISIEKYIDKEYEENTIEPEYKEIIENYRKFLQLRDIIKSIRSVDVSEKEPLCSICFDQTITSAFVPCGHTFCTNCSKKQAMACSVCRTPVRERIKIYFN